jgi:hemin uptake protein HemP
MPQVDAFPTLRAAGSAAAVSRSPGDVAQRQADSSAAKADACVESSQLLRGRRTVEINHNGSTYRLQATRLGKLILTK